MILGIDISKASFDAVLLVEQKPLHKAFDNNLSGFKALYRWLHKAAATVVQWNRGNGTKKRLPY